MSPDQHNKLGSEDAAYPREPYIFMPHPRLTDMYPASVDENVADVEDKIVADGEDENIAHDEKVQWMR